MGLFSFLFKDKAANEIRDRRVEIMTEQMNMPKFQRLLMASGIYQTPFSCKCGFTGNTSDEMETHFDKCKLYSDMIMDLIENKRK